MIVARKSVYNGGIKESLLNVERYVIDRPSRYKAEYHGNGKGAWYRTVDCVNGHTVERYSIRHSYRWHKTGVAVDGRDMRTAADYRKAEEAINHGDN
jgi:hypothetical protein